jgi:hypothetical protein
MDHTPRYHQPFTLAQAVLFDVSVISEGRYSFANATVSYFSILEQKLAAFKTRSITF